MFCGQCGTKNPNTNKFCSNCGSLLREHEPVSTHAKAMAELAWQNFSLIYPAVRGKDYAPAILPEPGEPVTKDVSIEKA